MQKYVKFLITSFIILFPFLFLHSNSQAVITTFSQDNYTQGEIIEIELLANPTSSDQNAVQIDLVSQGIKFIEYTNPENPSIIGVIPNCGEKYFEDNKVCVSIASSENLTNTTSIGKIKFQLEDPQNFSIVKTENNIYSDGLETAEDSGELFSSTNSDNRFGNEKEEEITNNTPNSPVISTNFVFYILIFFLVTLIFIIILLVIASKKKLTKKNLNRIVSIYSIILMSSIFGLIFYEFSDNLGIRDSSAGNAGLSAACNLTSDCTTGLLCVTGKIGIDGIERKYCSDLSLGRYCDKNLKQCNTGLTCVNNGVNVESYKCTNGKNYYSCNKNTDCINNLICVNSWVNSINESYKFCSNLGQNSPCDINTRQCNPNLTCKNLSDEGFYCTNGDNNSFCEKDSDCNSGLKCVRNFDTIKYCSNLLVGSRCDKDSQICNSGKCVNQGVVNYEYWCSSGDLNQACNIDSDCKNGLKCISLDGISKYCKDASTITPTPTVKPTVTITPTPTLKPTISVTSTPKPTITSTPTPTVCGNIDVNNDKKLDIIDFAAFAKLWGKSCSDTAPTTGCRGKDTNNNKKIDLPDFASLAKRWWPTTQKNCTI